MKSLKECLKKMLDDSKVRNNDHYQVIKPIVDEALSLVRVEGIDDDKIIEIENEMIKDFFNKIIEERKIYIYKLSDRKKVKEVEIESTKLAIISYYHKTCCDHIIY